MESETGDGKTENGLDDGTLSTGKDISSSSEADLMTALSRFTARFTNPFPLRFQPLQRLLLLLLLATVSGQARRLVPGVRHGGTVGRPGREHQGQKLPAGPPSLPHHQPELPAGDQQHD